MNGNTPGERVQHYRRIRGLSQRELAALSGLGLQTVKDLEAHRYDRPRVRTLAAVASVLRVTTSSLQDPGEPEDQAIMPSQWGDIRDALYRPVAPEEEPPAEQAVLEALSALLPDLARNRYEAVRARLPGLIRDAVALGEDGRTAQSRVANLTAWLLTQTRQFADAHAAVLMARDAATEPEDRVAAVNTECWLLLRQGRIGEADAAAIAAADDCEPKRFSRASDAELAGWGKLWLYVSNARLRDSRPGEAAEALRTARAAAARIGREVPVDSSTTRTFGPVSVAMISGENAALSGKPDATLQVAASIPKRGLLHVQSASRLRHRLDVAYAHTQLRAHGDAVEVMTALHAGAPEWFESQQYARDILDEVVRGRRTLTQEMRDLAEAVHLMP